jgi:hypothetical protein
MIKNWKTSLFGIVAILAGLYTGITGKSSWTEAVVIISIGTGLLFSKDHNTV